MIGIDGSQYQKNLKMILLDIGKEASIENVASANYKDMSMTTYQDTEMEVAGTAFFRTEVAGSHFNEADATITWIAWA